MNQCRFLCVFRFRILYAFICIIYFSVLTHLQIKNTKNIIVIFIFIFLRYGLAYTLYDQFSKILYALGFGLRYYYGLRVTQGSILNYRLTFSSISHIPIEHFDLHFTTRNYSNLYPKLSVFYHFKNEHFYYANQSERSREPQLLVNTKNTVRIYYWILWNGHIHFYIPDPLYPDPPNWKKKFRLACIMFLLSYLGFIFIGHPDFIYSACCHSAEQNPFLISSKYEIVLFVLENLFLFLHSRFMGLPNKKPYTYNPSENLDLQMILPILKTSLEPLGIPHAILLRIITPYLITPVWKLPRKTSVQWES